MGEYNGYEENCIHLHACRRLSMIARKKQFNLARQCDREKCSAFEDEGDYVPLHVHQMKLREAQDDAINGYMY